MKVLADGSTFMLK